MKNLRINKEGIMSLFLTGSVLISAYAGIRDIKKTKKESMPEPTPSAVIETVYNEFDGIKIDTSLINASEYTVISKDKENKITMDTYLYDDNGQAISYINAGDICNVVAINNNVALVSLTNGKTGYVLLNYLEHNYHSVDGYAYVKKGTAIYSDNQLHDLSYITDKDNVLKIYYITASYATIVDDNGDAVYVNPQEISGDIIDINLANQHIYCYLDYVLVASYPIRSGKTETPTNVGLFDIDWKAKDWTFIDYPDSKAKYWIAYDEIGGQGIHDLIGDDECNYGNMSYQQYGSHGCVRVSVTASEFVYNNYEQGDMVRVRKK